MERLVANNKRKYRNDDELTHLGLTLNPTVSSGLVLDIHRSKRDNTFLRFPSFSVDACFPAGMSGGAVFNDKKELCGLVSAGLQEDNKDVSTYYSNAVSIWPSMIITINLKEDGCIPTGIEANKQYKLLDFARRKIINISGYERIEFFEHNNGSDGVRLKHY